MPDEGSGRAPIMKLRQTSLVIAVALLAGSLGYGQAPTRSQTPRTPPSRSKSGDTLQLTSARTFGTTPTFAPSLKKGLPGLTVTEDPREIRRAQRALAKRIRAAREDARQGDIFTPAVAVEFREALRLEMDADTWAAIMDDNRGEFSNRINGTYSDKRPLSTVPPNILARLPRLPDDVQYRFLGRHLILHDTRANLILDRIPYAIRCEDCDTEPVEPRATPEHKKCRAPRRR